MGDILAIAVGLAARLATIEGLQTWDYVPDGTVYEPAAVVTPGPGTYGATYDRGADDMAFTITLLVSKGWTRTGQQRLNAFLAGSGPASVIAAIMAEQTLGGTVHFTNVVGYSEWGTATFGGVDYLSADINIEVTADGI